jgi:hypothetical protein
MSRLIVIFTLAFLTCVQLTGRVLADVKSFDLPADFADFALNPETGTVAAVDPDKNEIVFFRNVASAAPGQLMPSASAKTGKTPVSVTFKQFGETAVFAVVCSEDQSLFLFRAGGVAEDAEDFTLLKKVSLGVDGVSLVFGSRNPSDPFLYYCFGSGHDSMAGVFSLRDLKNHGRAFGDAMDAAVSAKGDIIYVRGPWSPSGFNSLLLQNSLLDEKPEFGSLFHEHDSRGAYFPDPFGRMTIAGLSAYDQTLAHKLGGVPILNPVFFESPLVIIGFASNQDPNARFGDQAKATDYQIQAVSYSTLSATGTPVKITSSSIGKAPNLPRGVNGQADFKSIVRQRKLIADDRNDTLLLGDRNRISVVSLAAFEIPDEPVLLADVEGLEEVVVGKPSTLKVITKDPRVKVRFDDLPQGMVAEGNELKWTPAEDQIGDFSILATLEADSIQKSITFEGHVVYPAHALSFNPSGMVISSDRKTLYAWEGQTPANQHPGLNGQSGTANAKYRIAAIEASSGKVLAERQVAESLSQVVDMKSHLLLLPSDRATGKCEILNPQTLERVKSLIASGPIGVAVCFGNNLVIRTNSTIEIYDSTDFRKIRQLPSSAQMNPQGMPISPVTPDGLLLNGVLYDEALKPILNQNSQIFPLLAQDGRNPGFQMNMLSPRHDPSQNSGYDPHGQRATAKIVVPESNLTFTAQVSLRQSSSPTSRFVTRIHEELMLTTSGAIDSSLALVRRVKPMNQSGGSVMAPVVTACENTAWVAFDKRLYTCSVNPPAGEDAVVRPLRLVRRQSQLSLDKGETTKLSHEVAAGKKPLEFALRSPMEGMSIDETSGIVTIDNQGIRRMAVDFLFRSGMLELSTQQTNMDGELSTTKLAAELLGEKPHGRFVSLPVTVTATDADLDSDTLQYLVLVDVPNAEIDQRLAQQKAELEKAQKEEAKRQMAEAAMQKARNPQGSPDRTATATSSEIAELKTKIDTLESRIDLLTRQLDELLKKLDK